jgi:hypothetical protein
VADILDEPDPNLADPADLLLGYLDFYRAVIDRKLAGLSDDDLRSSRLPSGWTPLELLKHLVFMERRWLRWGFAAEPVDRPWGDNLHADADERWYADPTETVADLLASMHAGGRRTRQIVAGTRLADVAGLGGRFDGQGPVPTLGWILFHVLQEYARHAGHLDVARELVDGETGE